VTIDGLTLVDNGALPTVDITAAGNLVSIQNCVFTKGGTATTAVGRTAVRYGNTVASGTGAITNNVFDSTLGAVTDTAIQVNQTGLTISGNTFSVDAIIAGVGNDIAIAAVAGITTITSNTVTGASGVGVQVTAGTATITGAILTTLDPALNILGGTIVVTDSTITGCGTAVSATVVAGRPAISVTATAGLKITNSTITGNPNDIMQVAANANLINVMFNDLSGNTLGIDNNDLVNTVQAPVNWWGSAAGPGTLNAGLVNASAPAGATLTGVMATGATATQLLASATQGIDVQPLAAAIAYVPGAGEVIGAGRYSANPGEALPIPGLTDGLYDVYFIQTATAGPAASQVLIKLYNPAITANTRVMVWSELAGTWTMATTQGVNTFGLFVWASVTATTTPSILDLSGTPFALVETVMTVPVAPVILTPAFGDMAAAIQPTFTWTASATATSYEFVLAEEIGQDDKFAIIDYSATTDINGHVSREQLKYDTVYNWHVRAVNATGAGAWTTGFFTTVAEPEPEPEPVPPVIIKETPPTPAPEIILNVPPATKQEVQVIPEYMIWVVVAVAAVLIIAVIVLIVRTRRVT
jgi:hypothetical protein